MITMQASNIFFAQAGISAICFAMATSILGTSAHTYHIFRTHASTNMWWLPIWESYFDVHGTASLIGGAATIVLLNLTFLVLNFLPKLNLAARPTPRALLSLTMFFPAAVIAFGTTLYAHILNHDWPQIATIQTWTCNNKDQTTTAEQPVDQSFTVDNSNFGQLCRESQFAIYGMMTLIILQSLQLLIAVSGWLYEKWAARKLRKEIMDDRELEMQPSSDGAGLGLSR